MELLPHPPRTSQPGGRPLWLPTGGGSHERLTGSPERGTTTERRALSLIRMVRHQSPVLSQQAWSSLLLRQEAARRPVVARRHPGAAWSSLGPHGACEGEQTAELRTGAGSTSADPVCSEGSIPREGACSDESVSPAALRLMELEPADEGQAEQSQKLRCDLETDMPAAGSLVPKNERSTTLATGTPVPPSFWHQGQYRVQQSAGMGSLVLLTTASEQTDDRAVEEPEAAVQHAPSQLDQIEPDNIDVGYLFLYDDGLSGSSTLGAKAPKGKEPPSILDQGPAPEPGDEEKGTAPGQEAEAGLGCSLVCDQPPTQSAEAAPLTHPGSSGGPCASRSL